MIIDNLIAKNVNRIVDTEGYNIFHILEIADKEVVMSRFIYDLLNVQGMHGQGTKYLRIFVEDILGINGLTEEELSCYQVYKEYVIDEGRRIDLVLSNGKHFVPIEVKINAGEQYHQCYDYYAYAKAHDVTPERVQIVYLTKNGSVPSEYSTYGKTRDEFVPAQKIKCISFRKDIKNWLEKCIVGDTSEVALMIKQYICAMDRMTRDRLEEMKHMVSEEILRDENNFRTSLMIVDSMDYAKAMLMQKLFLTFEEEMFPLLEKYQLKKETRTQWYSYEKQATEKFWHSYSTYPGLNYICAKAKLSGEKALWLRIEIEHHLFAGFCAFDYALESEEGSGAQLDEMDEDTLKEYRQCFQVPIEQPEDWWLQWIYLPTGSSSNYLLEQVPNFKEMNEAAVALVDDEKRREFVKKSVALIEERLLRLFRKDG